MDTLTLEQALAGCYDLNAPLLFFPVRHHSPACTVHLLRTLVQYRPDAVLIEGPGDTNHLMAHIGNRQNTAPLCVYYSYTQQIHSDGNEGGVRQHTYKKGAGEERRSACYYPMLDYSPELAAIRHCTDSGLPVRFIDLPYSSLSRFKRQEEGKSSYFSDYQMSRSRYIQGLCEKQGCRHYAELWEKLFELGGLEMDSEAFVRSMVAMCYFSRLEYPEEMLEQEGTVDRESYMAAEIQAACKEHKKVLVITGGFHTTALRELVKGTVKPPRLTGEASAYLIAYSFAESDQLAGYASGMPYPAFYQQVFELLDRGSQQPYNDAVLLFLAKIGGALRKKKESTSIADEVAALAQATGLAILRDKPQQGVYELLDAVRSAYVKGDNSLSAALMLDTAAKLLRGDKMGSVTTGVEQVPLVVDFRATAKRLRLKIETTAPQEITLEILSKPSHRQVSEFFHRMAFLQLSNPFCQRRSGPDYRHRDTKRVREVWKYAFGASKEAALVDVSYLGGTVEEAVSTLMGRARQESGGCGEYARLLIDAAVMGMSTHVEPILQELEDAVTEDGAFPSLALAVQNLLFLENAKWLLDLPGVDFVERLLAKVYHKAATLLPQLSTKDEREDRELAKSVKDLHQLAGRDGMEAAVLEEALLELIDRPEPPPCLQGSAVGLLYAAGTLDVSAAMGYARAYLFGTGEQMQKSGRFLEGLFLSAWDILFEGGEFLEGIGHVLESVSQEEFLAVLPDLRLAFSAFSPVQVDRLAGMVAQGLGIDRRKLHVPAQPEQLFALGQKLDQWAKDKMNGKEVGA